MELTKDEIKQKIKDNVKWDSKRQEPEATGGQSCGMPSYPIILISEELNLEITIGYYKSRLKNQELAIALFEITLDELIR